MRSPLSRDLAFLATGGRSARAGAAGLVVLSLLVYAGAYGSMDVAAFWAFVAPAALAFALTCALTTRDRESGFAALVFTAPVPVEQVLLWRLAAGTLAGTLAALLALFAVAALSILGLSNTPVGWRMLLAAPLLAAAASASGLLAGLALGERAGGAGAAVGAVGVVLLLGLPAAASAQVGNFPEGSAIRAVWDALGGLSPAGWVFAFAWSGDAWNLAGLLAYGGVALAGALVVAKAQTPLGAWRPGGPPRGAAAIGALVAFAVVVAPHAPDVDRDPWAAYENRSPPVSIFEYPRNPEPLRVGETRDVSLAIAWDRGAAPAGPVEVALEAPGPHADARVSVVPLRLLVPQPPPGAGTPFAAGSIRVRVDHLTTFAPLGIPLLARLTSGGEESVHLFIVAYGAKGSVEVVELAAVLAAAAAAVAAFTAPSLVRRAKLKGLAAGGGSG